MSEAARWFVTFAAVALVGTALIVNALLIG
jgi:hypothetical protein